ncbi:MAG TPA: diguanylate cyclase [Xanthomonadaceae bacterium]|jgi:diguanylate cyclase (GGDEF)-like protein/PAS domain S-box-containing protein|nr:diguanylate cyclase [Xanthomonadaceae bacterium]
MTSQADLSLAHVLDLLLDAIVVVDGDGQVVFASAACERIFGYTPAEMIGRQMIGMVHPDDREMTNAAAEEIRAGTPNAHFENRYIRKDGRVVHVMWSARWSEQDQARVAVARDITDVKRAQSMEDALHAISDAAHTAEDLLDLFQRIHEIIGGLLPARNFFVALYDAKSDELTFPYFVDEFDQPPAPRRLDISPTLSAQVIRTGKALLVTPTAREPLDLIGRIVGRDSIDWLGVPLSSHKGVIGALVVQSYSGDVRYTEKDKGLLQFVSTQVAAAIERKQTQTLLQHMAHHDALTDLPNRELFHDRLQAALALAKRNRQRLAVLYIDLDKFKQVNDTLGHTVGDLLLQDVARRIRECLRASDTVGRVGGDEFLVLLQDVPGPDDAAIVAEKIRIALARPFELAGHSLQIASSIGIAIHPDHGSEIQQLIRHADEAMYEAKREGGNRLAKAGDAGALKAASG